LYSGEGVQKESLFSWEKEELKIEIGKLKITVNDKKTTNFLFG
jgi:hypothetical protein